MARGLILVGALLLALGMILSLFPGAFAWFGRLPGDINIRGEQSRIFVPLSSMILISVLLSILSSVVHRFFH